MNVSWGSSSASRQSYAKEVAAAYDLNIRPVDSTEEALKGADLVVSATTTSTPFVKDHWLITVS